MPTEKKRQCGFQAVVLAGFSNNNKLDPISGEEKLPKPLIPVGNKAIILYTLEWLEKACIYDAIVVLQSTGGATDKLRSYLSLNYSGRVHYTVAAVDDDYDTADSLRKVSHLIDQDFLVILCDLITELDPRQILDMHRLHDPTMSAMFYENNTMDSKEPSQNLLIGIDTSHSALVYKERRSDVDNIALRMSLLNKFPRVRIHTDLQDAHLYIFKRWVLDMIMDKPHITSISKHLVQLLIKCQYQQALVEHEKVNKCSSAGSASLFEKALSLSTTASDDVDDKLTRNPLHPTIRTPVKTRAYVYRGGFSGRGSTIPSYFELNRHVTKYGANVMRVPATAEVDAKAQVGNDSMIGEYTKIDERSSVKKSCIGSHCVIGKNVKIVNSVIMNHVVIDDYAKIDGCVISSNAKISVKANVKDCLLSAEFVVGKDAQFKGEKLVDFMNDTADMYEF